LAVDDRVVFDADVGDVTDALVAARPDGSRADLAQGDAVAIADAEVVQDNARLAFGNLNASAAPGAVRHFPDHGGCVAGEVVVLDADGIADLDEQAAER